MAKTEVGLDIEVDFSQVGNFKKELKAATADLIAMNEKFGSTSKEAIAAAKRVAGLKDAIGDAKALADTFNPDKKFVALGGAVQGAVAGFSALQGAMGLFADKNKEVEQLLLKVQSAMALQQGLSGIAGSIDSFKLLAGTIKTQVVAAFTTLRGAMMATGIGLITSAVAFLVTNFDAVKNKLGELFPALKGAGDLMDRLKQIAMGVGNAILQFLAAPISAIVKAIQGDFKGAFEALKNGVAFTKNFREGEQKEIKDQADEREKIRQEELKKEQEANKKKLEEQRRAAAERLKKLQEQQEKEKQLRLAADKVLDDARRSKLTEQQRSEEDAIRKFEESKKTLLAAGIKDFTAIEEQRELELASIRKKYKDEEEARLAKEKEDKLKKEEEENQRLAEARQNTLDQQKAANEALIQAEIELQNRRFDAATAGLELLGTLAGENEKIANVIFAVQKGLEIARIITDTARGIVAAKAGLAAVPPFIGVAPNPAFVLAAATAAKQIVGLKVAAATSIASIAATSISKFKGGGGGASAGAGGGSVDTGAPLSPKLTPQVESTQVNTAAVNQMGNRAARAYVLNSDIQNEQQRNAYINRNASIG
jgi:chemotaxis protein histidine kinase CheA